MGRAGKLSSEIIGISISAIVVFGFQAVLSYLLLSVLDLLPLIFAESREHTGLMHPSASWWLLLPNSGFWM